MESPVAEPVDVRGLSSDHATHIELPKNSPLGFAIAIAAGAFGFGMIWQIWWLAVLAFFCIGGLVIYRAFEEEIEYTVTV
jgi:cytochrome o ubiquinol oxidase subunit 1